MVERFLTQLRSVNGSDRKPAQSQQASSRADEPPEREARARRADPAPKQLATGYYYKIRDGEG